MSRFYAWTMNRPQMSQFPPGPYIWNLGVLIIPENRSHVEPKGTTQVSLCFLGQQ